MKKNRLLLIIGMIIILTALGVAGYFVLNREDGETTLSFLDKQWISSNKNDVINLYIENNLPIFSEDGKGVFFDFLTDLEKDTELEFNRATESEEEGYSLAIKSVVEKNDLVIYVDNYALVTKDTKKYYELNEISNMTIGVISDELEEINTYLKGANNVSLKGYETLEELMNEFNGINEEGDQVTSDIDAIAIPKTKYLNHLLTSESTNISYNITELELNYVLTLGKETKLNSILEKYLNKWMSDTYPESFGSNFNEVYFDSLDIDEKEVVNFRSKRYTYGYTNNIPYEVKEASGLLGINSIILSNFESLASIEFVYKKYSNISSLTNGFNTNKTDIIFNQTNKEEFDIDVFTTVSNFDEKIVVISSYDNELIANSINSLTDKKVKVLADSKLEQELTDRKADIKKYSNISELINDKKTSDIIALDYNTYMEYSNSDLKDFKIDFEFNLQKDYSFLIRDVNDNKIFAKYFNFYLGFIVDKKIKVDGINTIAPEKESLIDLTLLLLLLMTLTVVICLVFIFKNRGNNKSKVKIKINKEDKIRYIDQLTSLKNRNYLNDNIESWDTSEVYPQCVIIIDLNNVAYINDNYGHNEGDKIIASAANTLITTQIENSDIVRTNGNEFLVYLVGHKEKQVVSYIRKLYKDFKGLEHGFGAAIGYSMINDGIKTIDDAVNEATLDMKSNKEVEREGQN